MKNTREKSEGAMDGSGKINQINEGQIHDHLAEMVRDTVEDTFFHGCYRFDRYGIESIV